jgi:predicted dehydrogenase
VDIALVGCGLWGSNVLRDLRILGCRVHVVARSAASVGRARDGGAVIICSDIRDLGHVDGIVVVTPIETHAQVLEAALARGVPVFVEKPLCDEPEGAARLATLAPDRLFVMDKWRYHPAVSALAEIARRRTLGHVHELRTVRVQPGNRHLADAVWVLAPHDLAIALEVLGDVPRPRAASGVWADGRLVTMHALLESEAGWQSIEISEQAQVNARRVELHCAEGTAVLADSWDEYVHVQTAAGTERVHAPGELPLLAELRAFADFIEGGPPPRSSAAEGAAIVTTIAGLRELAA